MDWTKRLFTFIVYLLDFSVYFLGILIDGYILVFLVLLDKCVPIHRIFFSSDDNSMKRLSSDSGSCLMMDDEWFDSLCIYKILLSLLKNGLSIISESQCLFFISHFSDNSWSKKLLTNMDNRAPSYSPIETLNNPLSLLTQVPSLLKSEDFLAVWIVDLLSVEIKL